MTLSVEVVKYVIKGEIFTTFNNLANRNVRTCSGYSGYETHELKCLFRSKVESVFYININKAFRTKQKTNKKSLKKYLGSESNAIATAIIKDINTNLILLSNTCCNNSAQNLIHYCVKNV